MISRLPVNIFFLQESMTTWVKVQNFQNPELKKINLKNMQYNQKI